MAQCKGQAMNPFQKAGGLDDPRLERNGNENEIVEL
jgi:hypothetical protein